MPVDARQVAQDSLDRDLRRHTPSSHSKNLATKICSKGWVAQKSFLIGSLTAALRFSKGWARKDANLGLRTGCTALESAREFATWARAKRTLRRRARLYYSIV